MQREVNDGDGITWTCVQAYAGLTNDEAHREASQVEGAESLYEVVCTPSGGAQTVRLQLKGNWHETLSDEALLDEIRGVRARGG